MSGRKRQTINHTLKAKDLIDLKKIEESNWTISCGKNNSRC